MSTTRIMVTGQQEPKGTGFLDFTLSSGQDGQGQLERSQMPDTVSKAHLVDKISEKHGLSKKEVKAVVDEVFDHISLHLNQGDKVQITGFGTFEVRERAARTGVKPGTSEKMTIPAKKSPAFKAGKSLKDSVNQ